MALRSAPRTFLLAGVVACQLVPLSSPVAAFATGLTQDGALTVALVGGPNFVVAQANPTDPDVISVPAGDQDPLVIRAVVTNTGAVPFVGIPASTNFQATTSDPFLLSGVTAEVAGNLVFEGQGLTDVVASFPFVGGFVLLPGESREFVLHVIYGLVCNACTFPATEPALVPAPCGVQKTLTRSNIDIRDAELINGVVVGDPDDPGFRLPVAGPYPLTVTVGCVPASPEEGVEQLLDTVEDLQFSGSLNRGHANALTRILEGALEKLEGGKRKTAVNRLNAFTRQVQGLVAAAVLTASEAQALVDAANAVIDLVNAQ